MATPIRLVLEHAGVEYEEKLYKTGPPPDFDRQDWLNDKFNLGLDFPNLPYWIDGDVKLTQSMVILRHLARQHGLDGKTEADKARADLVAAQVFDYHMEYARVVYNPSFLDLKDNFVKTLPDKMQKFSDFLGDRKFVVGDYLTWADFVLFEHLEFQSNMVPDLLKDHPNLSEFHQRISSLESVQKYFNSPKAIKFPFNGAPAYFGGQYSDILAKK